MTEPDATGPSPAAIGPHDVPRHAGQVVRRVLLRRKIVIDAETAQLVAAAVQAGVPSRDRQAADQQQLLPTRDATARWR